MGNALYRSSSKPLYTKLNNLQIEDIYKHEIAKFMFNSNIYFDLIYLELDFKIFKILH